jgi:hypothetical protein
MHKDSPSFVRWQETSTEVWQPATGHEQEATGERELEYVQISD